MLTAQARTLAAAFERHGIEVPQIARDTLLTVDAAQAALNRHVSEEVRAAIRAGKVNPKNVADLIHAAALAAAAKPGCASLILECDVEWGNQAMQALRGDPAPVLDQLRPKFVETAAIVAEGAKFFDESTYSDPGRILAKRPEASAAYSALGPAMGELDSMAQLVGEVLRFDRVRLPGAAFFVAAPAVDGLPPFTGTHRWLTLYGPSGAAPALNDVATAQAVLAAAKAAVAALTMRPKSNVEKMREVSAKKEADAWAATVAR